MQDEQFELVAGIEEKHWWFLGRRSIIKRIVRQVLPPSQCGGVIDVGCGTGANLAALASDYHCLGIDVSEHAIRLAKRRFPAIQFLCSDLSHVEVRPAPGPRIWLLLDVLEHVEDDVGFLSGLLASMKEGDYLLITVPAYMSLWATHDVTSGHHRRYHRAMLERVWKGAAVHTVFVTYFNVFLFPLIYAVRMYSRLRKKEWGHAGTDLALPKPWLNKLLESVFSSEGAVIDYLLNRGYQTGWPFGASLIALLRKGSK